jgi:hypothetical protein
VRPSRSAPALGAPARIRHFGGETENVTIVELRDGGRCVVVAGADAERCEFTLRRATAVFVAAGHQHSPRLEF